ncbi:hypothetical protein Fmac_008944 [Flemingia macrophylla]|uniref:Retrotransposon Copia-like N-terminal domain-containing protein n=1 Tax=Flemingia macrophylla TaxID=520843 RepID=A0ABD1MYW0_9FABA
MANPINHLLDSTSVYFLASNEQPALALISTPLNDSNYHSWSQTMLLVLRMKNKVGFVDGSLPRPVVECPTQMAWDRCNKFVSSWIIQSLDPSLVPSERMNTGFEVWFDLKHRFCQHDMSKGGVASRK